MTDTPRPSPLAYKSRPVVSVKPNLIGRVKCPACGFNFSLKDLERWNGRRHLTCGQRLEVEGDSMRPEIFCVVGNIIQRPRVESKVTRLESNKHFRPGAKVYCFPPLWGGGYDKIKVVGRRRGSGGKYFIQIVIDARWIGNARAQLVYDPYVIDVMSPEWKGDHDSKREAEQLAQMVNGYTFDEG